MNRAEILIWALCAAGTAYLIGSCVRAIFWPKVRRRMATRRQQRLMGWRRPWDRVR